MTPRQEEAVALAKSAIREAWWDLGLWLQAGRGRRVDGVEEEGLQETERVRLRLSDALKGLEEVGAERRPDWVGEGEWAEGDGLG